MEFVVEVVRGDERRIHVVLKNAILQFVALKTAACNQQGEGSCALSGHD